jgi:prolyl 4-hydroxylase
MPALRNAWYLVCVCGTLAASVRAAQVEVGADGTSAIDSKPRRFEVKFANEDAKPVELYWQGNDDAKKIGDIEPKSHVIIKTFPGHHFYYSQVGGGGQIALATFLMNESVPLYSQTNRLLSSEMDDSLDPACRDTKKASGRPFDCNQWAKMGHCDSNPGWMIMNCPTACKACHLKKNPKIRCDRERMGISTTPAYAPGDMNKMFENIFTNYKQYSPVAVHRDPWVVTLDDVIKDDEIDALLYAVRNDFQRSTDTGAYNDFGAAAKVVSKTRTSNNAWCRSECENDPLVKRLSERIGEIVGIPQGNFESFQVLKYTEGQYYRSHHDYGSNQRNLACGPRVLTFFMYLSDVEEGGETKFNNLDLKVKPKKGRAVLWPSVMDQDLLAQDKKTHHEAMPVTKGLKIAANSWIHLYDYKVPNLWGCTGSFD